MTPLEVIYELEAPLEKQQLWELGKFANTYGLRKLRVDEEKNLLIFEYDASRMRETQVEHVLRNERIPIKRRVEPTGH